MITVYVREVGELEGHFLGDFAPDEIADVVQMFHERPIYADEGLALFAEARIIAAKELYGGCAVFEILVRDETST